MPGLEALIPRPAIQEALEVLERQGIGKAQDPSAWAMLVAIGLQESRFKHRAQVVAGGGKGPARGFWQFEQRGGVYGVLNHPLTKKAAETLCGMAGIQPTPAEAWAAMETNDILAAGFARMLLFTDPNRLPPASEAAKNAAWEYYIRNWRPGKPHRQTWDEFWTDGVRLSYAPAGDPAGDRRRRLLALADQMVALAEDLRREAAR